MHISIILPVYNAELYLKSTIDSILNQTYPYFELLIIDDCSTDSSYDIINTFIQNDNRIFYFKLSYFLIYIHITALNYEYKNTTEIFSACVSDCAYI